MTSERTCDRTCYNAMQKQTHPKTESAPHSFQATQLEIEDEMAPLLPPDFIDGIQFKSEQDARRKYKELRQIHCRKRNQFIPGALHKHLFENKFHVLDHETVGDFDIAIKYTLCDQVGKKMNTTGRNMCTGITWVKVRSARYHKPYLKSLLAVDARLAGRLGSVRINTRDRGRMWPLGVKNRGKMTMKRKLYKATEYILYTDRKSDKIHSPFLPVLNHYMTEFFRRLFPKELEEVRSGNKDIAVDEHTRGDGSLHTFMISRDLANSSHVDSGDQSISICTWTESKPGTAKNWFLVFQNTSLRNDPSKAIVIKLSHGLTISWDGRVLHHCTSVTSVGFKNHVYGNFTGVSKAKTRG